MKLFINIFIICLFFASCNRPFSENRKAEEIFRESFGLNLTNQLDFVIIEVDRTLMEIFKKDNPSAAYQDFLNYLSQTDDCHYQIELSPSEIQRFLNLYETNGLRPEIWTLEHTDSVDYISINLIGQYLTTMQKIDSLDCSIQGYYKAHWAAGAPSYSLMTRYLIENKIDLDDYLVKVIIVADFFYYVLRSTAYNTQ